ncbi:MAG: succinate dehydrogenase, cytochrome b556 subunit [Alphaproteobacteria bacterium]|nr:succinate dehydrogenase, cytochrome b556 subunit [Alphaproteobacteria bacterium]
MERPLSPFWIYRPQITSVLSITHRITGVALSVGAPLLVWWLWAAAYSPECYEYLQRALTTRLGMVLLFGWSFAFFYHLACGIRHLFLDMGMGFALKDIDRTGIAVVLFSLLMTGGVWCYVLKGWE